MACIHSGNLGFVGIRIATPCAMLFYILIVTGCATYRPMPLTMDEVSQSVAVPDKQEMQIRAALIKHPLLKPILIDLSDGLSPDEAAIVAVIVNPSLRVERDGLALAHAQLLKAGILPNPQLSYTITPPVGGSTAGSVISFGTGLSWEATSLISRSATVNVAEENQEKVNLAVAWQELQIAQAARIAVYRIRALNEQVTLQKEKKKRLEDNLAVIQEAVQKSLMTELDLWAARAALSETQSMLLSKEKDIKEQFLTLNRVLGFPPDYKITVQDNIDLPDHLDPPPFTQLSENLGSRRLDLLALRHGYESQEAAVRAAICKQFPKINIGVNQARSDSNLYTLGIGVSIDLPIFSRNQGDIAIECASRQQLFDEYANRVFEAKSNIAALIVSLRSLNQQVEQAKQSISELEPLLLKYRKAINEGLSDIIVYYNTWNTLTQKHIDLIEMKRTLIEADIALAITSGYYKMESPVPDPVSNTERKQ